MTDAYLGLEKDVKECQNEEPLDNCTTRYHIETFLKQCGCLPFKMRLSEEV